MITSLRILLLFAFLTAPAFGCMPARYSGTDNTAEVHYHYTDENGAKGIFASRMIRKSVQSTNQNDAAFGSGVYLSDLSPLVGKDAILDDCWTGVPKEEKLAYTDFVFCVKIGRHAYKLESCRGRKGCYRFKDSDLQLTDYNWCIGKFEEFDKYSVEFLTARSELWILGHDFDADHKLAEFDVAKLELTSKPFTYDVTGGDGARNQRRYEEIGDVVIKYIRALLKSKVYNMTENGLWSRSLVMNEGLQIGSQLPFIDKAKEKHFAVVLFDTNSAGDANSMTQAREGWRQLMRSVQPNAQITVVGHSWAGQLVTNLASEFYSNFDGRVSKIFLTSSTDAYKHDGSKVANLLRKKAMNYAPSTEKLGTKLPDNGLAIPQVSAGTNIHIRTSYTTRDIILSRL